MRNLPKSTLDALLFVVFPSTSFKARLSNAPSRHSFNVTFVAEFHLFSLDSNPFTSMPTNARSWTPYSVHLTSLSSPRTHSLDQRRRRPQALTCGFVTSLLNIWTVLESTLLLLSTLLKPLSTLPL